MQQQGVKIIAGRRQAMGEEGVGGGKAIFSSLFAAHSRQAARNNFNRASKLLR